MLSQNNLQQLKELKTEIRSSKDLHRATVRGTRWRYGFARLKDGRDILLPAEEMLRVYPDDLIEVNVISEERKRPFAKIEKLIKSPLKYLVGRIIYRKKHCFLTADVHGIHQNLFVPPPFRNKAQDGDYVYAQVIQHPFKEGKAQVKILEVIKGQDQPLILSYVLKKYQLQGMPDFAKYQSKVEQAYTKALADEDHRTDLTALNFVTIDNAQSTDLDDALYAEEQASGWNLKVAIADPCELVAPNSPIEKYARSLASSLYLPKFQLPMLPAYISSELGSLLPAQPRLALVCDMQVSSSGEITSVEVYQAIIQSAAKLNYSNVSEALTANASDDSDTAAQLPLLTTLNALSEHLAKRHNERSMSNDNHQFELKLNDKYALVEVAKHSAVSAQKLVEHCMVACNQSVASWMTENKVDSSLYSVQSGFRDTQLTLINQLLQTRESEFSDQDLTQLENFSGLIQECKQRAKDEHCADDESALLDILRNLLERSQLDMQAKPHFALGVDYYTSFTSPLRRYQDFTLHRAIKAKLLEQPAPTLKPQHIETLNEHILRNRQAAQQVRSWLLCDYFNARKQAVYAARISQMQGKLIQAELNAFPISGNLDMRDFKDFKFNGSKMCYSKDAEHYVLNQEVTVKLLKIDWKNFSPVFKLVFNTEQQATASQASSARADGEA